jgi:AcrR family transcriptional regulator
VNGERRSVVTENTGPASPGPANPGPAHPEAGTTRRLRADARRNVDSLLGAAATVFSTSGVEAPAKEIADLAGVGVGTLYRHFPRRSDLVVAVLERSIDACAEAGPALSGAHEPGEALALWIHQYTELLATKRARGLAAALHSGDPAFAALPGYFMERLGPVLESLLEAAASAGDVRADIRARDILLAVAYLCQPVLDEGLDFSRRMVALLIDGLRRGGEVEPLSR